jgi:hypothetical protein
MTVQGGGRVDGPASVPAGTEIILNVTADDNYTFRLDGMVVTNTNTNETVPGNWVEVFPGDSQPTSGIYQFAMPAAPVTVTFGFNAIQQP